LMMALTPDLLQMQCFLWRPPFFYQMNYPYFKVKMYACIKI